MGLGETDAADRARLDAALDGLGDTAALALASSAAAGPLSDQVAIAGAARCPVAVLQELAGSRHASVRLAVATNTAAPEWVREKLTEDADDLVAASARRWLAGAPPSVPLPLMVPSAPHFVAARQQRVASPARRVARAAFLVLLTALVGRVVWLSIVEYTHPMATIPWLVLVTAVAAVGWVVRALTRARDATELVQRPSGGWRLTNR